jgi:hypothetical protein
MDCGYNAHPEALDFDHRDPAQKASMVSRIKTLSLESLMAEIAKCDVVCANCHRVRTHARRGEARAKASGAVPQMAPIQLVQPMGQGGL